MISCIFGVRGDFRMKALVELRIAGSCQMEGTLGQYAPEKSLTIQITEEETACLTAA